MRAIADAIPRRSISLFLLSLLGVILGFLRESLVAYYFGVSELLDALLVALVIPLFLSSAIPQLSLDLMLPRYLQRLQSGNKADARRILQQWFYACLAGMLLIALLLSVSSEWLVRLVAPGFTPAQQGASAKWLRILTIFMVFAGVCGTFQAVLNSHRQYVVPLFARQLINATVLFSIVLVGHQFGLLSVVSGYTIGSIAMFVLLWRKAERLESRLLSLPSMKIRWELPYSAGAVMLIQASVQQLGSIVDRYFASFLPEGSISAFNYAMAINTVPTTVFSMTMATMIFPILTEMVSSGKTLEAFKIAIRWISTFSVLSIVPVVLLIIFREEIVTILLARGQFDSRAVKMTCEALEILPLNIAIMSVWLIMSKYFLAQKMATFFSMIVVVGVVLRVACNYFLIEKFGLYGLAISNVVSHSTGAGLFVYFGWKHYRK